MRLSKRSLAAVFLFTLLHSAELRAQHDPEEVARAVRDHWNAINRNDVERVEAQHVADVSLFITETGARLRLDGSPDAERALARWRGSSADWHPRDLEVRMLGEDAAVATFYLDGSITWADGTVDRGPRRVTEVWTRTPEGWKEAHHHDDPMFPGDAREQIERQSESVFQSLLDGRMAGELWSDGVVLHPPGEPSVSGDAARAYLGGISDVVDFVEIRDHEREIEVLGSLAFELGTYTARVVESGGTEQTVYPRYAVVWRLQPDGAWRIDRDIWNFGAR